MKNLFRSILMLLVFGSTSLFAQKGATHIFALGGGSITYGNYSALGFDSDAYNNFEYPFSGGGAENGFNIGFGTSYYLTKNLGFNVEWNYTVNSNNQYTRQSHFETYWGDQLSSYESTSDKWVHNSLFVGSIVSFPALDNKLSFDLGANIGVGFSSVPITSETVTLVSGTTDTFNSHGGNVTSLATKFDVGVRYFINDFGIGIKVSSLVVYNSSKTATYHETYYNGFSDSDVDGTYDLVNADMINYSLSLTYRLASSKSKK